MQDENEEVELIDDELRKLLAPLAATPLLTPEEEDEAIARLKPEIDAAIARKAVVRPVPIVLPIPGSQSNTGS